MKKIIEIKKEETKYFCDICGKEMVSDSFNNAHWIKNYPPLNIKYNGFDGWLKFICRTKKFDVHYECLEKEIINYIDEKITK